MITLRPVGYSPALPVMYSVSTAAVAACSAITVTGTTYAFRKCSSHSIPRVNTRFVWCSQPPLQKGPVIYRTNIYTKLQFVLNRFRDKIVSVFLKRRVLHTRKTMFDRVPFNDNRKKYKYVCTTTNQLNTKSNCHRQWRIQKFWKGSEDNLWAPSAFIANAHNEIYAFYTETSGFKNMSQ